MNFTKFSETVYVVQDNIDTDQILSAQFLTINPEIEEGYQKLGTLAMCGLPDFYPPFISPDTKKAIHPIIVAGKNFGCGSSREHAPIALGASGIKVIIAQSFARIFLRNCLMTGKVIPLDISEYLNEVLITGDKINICVHQEIIEITTTVQKIVTKPLDNLIDLIQAGGLFSYARQSGKLSSSFLSE
jgi:3-isopropylmalate/(R)-2-methylmalate dehydratase small subunit